MRYYNSSAQRSMELYESWTRITNVYTSVVNAIDVTVITIIIDIVHCVWLYINFCLFISISHSQKVSHSYLEFQHHLHFQTLNVGPKISYTLLFLLMSHLTVTFRWRKNLSLDQNVSYLNEDER